MNAVLNRLISHSSFIRQCASNPFFYNLVEKMQAFSGLSIENLRNGNKINDMIQNAFISTQYEKIRGKRNGKSTSNQYRRYDS
jgi:hypothetical protein